MPTEDQEFGGKHKSMKNQKGPGTGAVAELIRPPAYPIHGNALFQRVGAAVSAARGYPLGNVGFARLMGRSPSTTSSWFGVSPQPHLVSFLCLLEQLAPQDRHRVVDDLCRDLPSVDHPRLRHNQITVGKLKGLLALDSGLSFVTGGIAPQRSFVLSALGHTFCRMDRLHRTAVGLDLQEPSWFVPIETVVYLRGLARQGEPAAAVRAAWQSVRSSKQPLILLNGVWSGMPELRPEIVSLSSTRHIIVAEQDAPPASALSLEGWLRQVKVSTSRENPSWLMVEVLRV